MELCKVYACASFVEEIICVVMAKKGCSKEVHYDCPIQTKSSVGIIVLRAEEILRAI